MSNQPKEASSMAADQLLLESSIVADQNSKGWHSQQAFSAARRNEEAKEVKQAPQASLSEAAKEVKQAPQPSLSEAPKQPEQAPQASPKQTAKEAKQAPQASLSEAAKHYNIIA